MFKFYSLPQTHKQKRLYTFYSHHYSKIKTGLIIGFYLTAFRIYNPQHLDEEFKYIEHSI